MPTKLQRNKDMIERHRQLWLEKDEWELADSLSDKVLIDVIKARLPDLDDSEWTELHDAVVANI